MINSTITLDNGLVFNVRIEEDPDSDAPWKECEGHGPVSEWTTRDKRAGELVLDTGRSSKRYYDFAEACCIALRDGWDHLASKPEAPETRRQRAARAARADYEYLRAWCNDEWRYVGVIVTLLNPDGGESEITESLWSVEDNDADQVALQLAEEIAAGRSLTWKTEAREVYVVKGPKP